MDPQAVLRDTRAWLERAVIGLNLCPFAKAVHVKGQIHYAVCHACEPADILAALREELTSLLALDASQRDTTLLILPAALPDFLDFNDFFGRADRLIGKLGLRGIVQLASFHPRYQFAGTEADDIGNCTNRSPYPMLHLLREESIDRAVGAFPDASTIYEANLRTLTELGAAGWARLDLGPKP
ncbi:MAG: DUF1415 domain-containing protein [Burkholderiaceae bacterium]|nr:DUF1415 domain-containing protein [Burkholderiaceae bacterium]MDP3137252.1 DUF1415 domain-containing protein [Burkholderiaceae bacterium]